MFKNALKIRQLSVKELCRCAMLLAITCVLSYLSGFLRIGSFAKFNVSFVPVYMAGAAFGPWVSGLVGALADVVSFLVNPTGAFVPVFTIIEFVNGFLFGLLLYHEKDKSMSFVRLSILTVFCVVLQYGVNIIRTYFLAEMYFDGKFAETFVVRALPTAVMAAVKIAVILALEPVTARLSELARK